MSTPPKDTIITALTPLLTMLRDVLDEASARSAQACAHIQKGGPEAALGALADVERVFHEAAALHSAAVALYRMSKRSSAPVRSARRLFIEAIHVTGGLLCHPNGTRAPCADPTWTDLADAYLAACTEAGVAPVITAQSEPSGELVPTAARAPISSDQTQPGPAVTFSDVIRRFPAGQLWHTGGGCHAWRLDCEPGSYVLVTACDAAQAPADHHEEVEVGRYAVNGEPLEEEPLMAVEELPDWINDCLERAVHPKSVGDYFIRKLGEDPHDESLYDLLIVSDCGEDCVCTIDAAADLIGHVRTALGRDGEIVPGSTETRRTPEGDIVAAARQVIGVYWRG